MADPTATLLAEDEADMQLLPILRATPAPDAGAGVWQRVGQQVRIPTPGQNAKRGVFGALNLRTGEWFYQLAAHKRSADFIAFLGRLVAAYPTGLIYVLVDNASIHTSKAVQQWRVAQGRVVLLYLPTYSGHRLNPVEKVWWALKDKTPYLRRGQVLRPIAPSAIWSNWIRPSAATSLTSRPPALWLSPTARLSGRH